MGRTRKALRRQRPKKSRRLPLTKFVLIAAIVLLVPLSGWFGYQALQKLGTTQRAKPIIHWQVLMEGIPQDEKVLASIHAAIAESCKQGLANELTHASQLLQSKLEVERVRIVRTGYNQLFVHIKPRQAYLRIHTGQVRLLSESGQVYGHAGATHKELALLKGIPMDDISWRTDGTLALSDDAQALVDQAIDLSRRLGQRDVEVAMIEYVPYRGFLITQPDSGIEIMVGYKPFEDKLSRLTELIDDIKKKSSHVERIELDYQGKAFIKAKKS